MNKYPIPFQIVADDKPFLTCRYNQVGDKHRSPWTNQLYPVPEEENGKSPDNDNDDQQKEELRLLEATTNEVWDSYKNLYYGHEAVGSVYLRETEKGAFQGLFGIYKKTSSGSWHSVSLVHVDEPGEETCHYRVETSALIVLEKSEENDNTVKFDLSAMLSKEVNKECKISPTILAASHIENLGALIEANEMELRSHLERVQIPKTTETVDTILKEKEKTFRPPVNPLMGLIQDSSVLKKKIAKEAEGE